jgi:hypothetical protein
VINEEVTQRGLSPPEAGSERAASHAAAAAPMKVGPSENGRPEKRRGSLACLQTVNPLAAP